MAVQARQTSGGYEVQSWAVSLRGGLSQSAASIHPSLTPVLFDLFQSQTNNLSMFLRSYEDTKLIQISPANILPKDKSDESYKHLEK